MFDCSNYETFFTFQLGLLSPIESTKLIWDILGTKLIELIVEELNKN